MAFELKSNLLGGLVEVPIAASAEKIWVGNTVIWNGSGYAIKGGQGTLTCPEFIGIATATVDNSGGGAGAKTVTCTPITPYHSYEVKVLTGTTLAQSHCGVAYDVNDVVGGTGVQELDLTDTTFAAKSYGFLVEEVITAGDNGTVRGHFVLAGAFD